MIQNHHADEEQAGSQQTHDQIANGGRQRRTVLIADHDQSAGGQGIDFHEYVGREQIVRKGQGQQRRHQQAYHRVIELGFLRLHILPDMSTSPSQYRGHHQGESQSHQRFQRSDPDFVSPGSREVAHHIPVAFAGTQGIYQRRRHHGRDHSVQADADRHGRPGLQRAAYSAAGQAQHNRRERKILNQRHFSSSARAIRIISSSSRVW